MWTNLSGNPSAISVVFRPTLCNVFIFNQRRPIIFFVPSRMFSYSLSLKKFSVKVAMVFRANSTDVAFRVTLDCSNWIGIENHNRPQQEKDSMTNIDRKKSYATSAKKHCRLLYPKKITGWSQSNISLSTSSKNYSGIKQKNNSRHQL